MKTNLRKVSGVVLAVGMMSALSLTAFGADGAKTVPMTKTVPAVKAETVKMKTVKLDSESMTADVITRIATRDAGADTVDITAAKDFELQKQPDGSFKMKNKKTGDSFEIAFDVSKEGKVSDGNSIKAATITAAKK